MRVLCVCCVGVRNVTALGNLITWQKVDYDFNYHQMEFPCNINVLIASEGRSLLPVSTKIPKTPPNMAREGFGFLQPLVRRAASDAEGCFQPVSRCHWLTAATPLAGGFSSGLTLVQTARGMCCVLFLVLV